LRLPNPVRRDSSGARDAADAIDEYVRMILERDDLHARPIHLAVGEDVRAGERKADADARLLLRHAVVRASKVVRVPPVGSVHRVPADVSRKAQGLLRAHEPHYLTALCRWYE